MQYPLKKTLLSILLLLVLHSPPRALAFTAPALNHRYSQSTLARTQPLLTIPKNPLSLQVSLRPEDLETVDLDTTNELKKEAQQDHHLVEKVDAVGQVEMAEFIGIAVWLVALSSFILVNNFVGPWPQEFMKNIPAKTWLLCHYLGGMLFAGGIIMTTAIEWMVASTKNKEVMEFWFGQVPVLDAAIVLPGLTMAMVAGTGVSIHHYGGLGETPGHIATVFYTLVAAATWWGLTDLTTQHKTATAIEEWEKDDEAPGILNFRRVSNVVSCMFILALYGIMTFKPFMA